MSKTHKTPLFSSAREKFLGLSLESNRKSYYPQLQAQLEAAKENERRLQLLIDSLPARISYVNIEEHYVLVNSAYEKAFGLTKENIVGHHKMTILGEKNYANVRQHVQDALRGKSVHYETCMTGTDGEKKWFDVSYIPDINNQGDIEGFYVLALDLTEKKKEEEIMTQLESKLQEIQKFKAIGTLAGGIAHDFNNLLMGIQGRASLMSAGLPNSHPLTEHLQAIEDYIHSATELTKQLLGFARGSKYEVKPVDVSKLVLDSAELFRRTRKEIRIHWKLNQTLLIVEVDKNQLKQVLLNMYVNSWQAMPDGGNLYLQTRTATLDPSLCKAHGIPEDSYAMISITDTGIGMDKATRRRVFDPFFTTKEKQRGTGLGLTSAYGIVKNHGGIITVYSEVNRGTTFNIYLPLSHKHITEEQPSHKSLETGTETVLLVDDEELIIDVSQKMLVKLGYTVHVAYGGEHAIKILEKLGSEVDLVILDLIMPGLDGGKTFEKIRDLLPNMPVLLSSGYSINGLASEVMKKGCNGFIQKPFNLIELSNQIRKIFQQQTKS